MRFTVVTKVEGGNMATAIGQVHQQDQRPGEANDYMGTYKPVEPLVALQLFLPVWSVGEIVVLDENDRTIPDGRKPSKWFIETEDFDTVEEAVARSLEVVRARDRELLG